MGQCCSRLPADSIGPTDRTPTISSARHAIEPGVDAVNVPAAVHASSTQHSPQQHHLPHPYSAQDRRSGVNDVEGRAQQRPLLPVPSLQLQPHSNFSSLHQLRLLLPEAPLQQLATLHACGRKSTRSASTQSKGACARNHSSMHTSLLAASTHNSRVTHSAHGTAQQQLHTARKPGRGKGGGSASAGVMMPVQILSTCAAVVQDITDFQTAGLTPLLLASLCLIESAGYPRAKQHRNHLGDTSHGICQVVLSTAQWLATSQGFSRHGTCPSVRDLETPAVCIYFAAAYLSVLSRHEGISRSEGSVVKAYHAGPNHVSSAAASTYLMKYLKAKHYLTQVSHAMAITVAAAALKIDLQLPCTLQLSSRADDSAQQLPCATSGTPKTCEAHLSSSRASPCACDCKERDSVGARDVNSAATQVLQVGDGCVSRLHHVCSASRGSSQQAVLPRASAAVVDMLCTSWYESQGVADAACQPTGGAACGAALNGLPSKEDCARHQQQQQQQHDQKQGSTANRQASCTGSASTMVLVSTDTLHSAWLMLLCISPAVAQAALEQATAFQARSTCSPGAQSTAGLTKAAALPTITTSNTQSLAGSSSTYAGGEASAANESRGWHHEADPGDAAAVAHCVAQVPCMLHIVGHGETPDGIAQTCNLTVADLLAANPDITEAAAIRCNDCIAIPVPAVVPRLHVVRQGDTLTSIARAYGVSLGRIFAKNPELAELSRVQPGWVVALPGLKGDSQVSLPADWLADTALTADLQELTAGASGKGPGLRYQQELPGAPRRQQPCQMHEPQHQGQAVQGHTPHKHNLLNSGAVHCALQADTRQAMHCRQQRMRPALPVGSGAFLFALGGHNNNSSSGGGGESTEHLPSHHRHQPQPQPQISGADVGVCKHLCKGNNGSTAAAGAGRGWTVSTHPFA